MTGEQHEYEALKRLRKEGYAIVVFNPGELAGADPSRVEERLVELGWDVIDALKAEGNEQRGETEPEGDPK